MENGFNILKDVFKKQDLDLITRDYNTVALQCKNNNIFKNSNNEIIKLDYCQNFSGFNYIGKYINDKLHFKGEIINMQYLISPPNNKLTPPHQQGIYFDNNEDIIILWIPLQKVNTKTSTMFFVDWDGNKEILEHHDYGSNLRIKTNLEKYVSKYPLREFLPVNLDYGDCIVYNQYVVNYTSVNSTDKPMLAINCIIKSDKK